MINLDKLRLKISKVDKKICRLFDKRMDLSKQIGIYKKENNLPIENKDQEAKVIEKNLKFIKNENKDYYKKLISVIIKLSKEIQSK